MNLAIDILLHAGRSAVDVALYTLLPIMVLMMIVMRAVEASGSPGFEFKSIGPHPTAKPN